MAYVFFSTISAITRFTNPVNPYLSSQGQGLSIWAFIAKWTSNRTSNSNAWTIGLLQFVSIYACEIDTGMAVSAGVDHFARITALLTNKISVCLPDDFMTQLFNKFRGYFDSVFGIVCPSLTWLKIYDVTLSSTTSPLGDFNLKT